MSGYGLIKNGFLFLLSVLLLWVGTSIVGTDKVVNELKQFPAWTVTTILAMFALNLAIVSFRLDQLLKYFGVEVPYNVALKACLQGHFASLFFISLFGQVAGRQTVLRHYGTPAIFIASMSVLERLVLFAVSGLLCLLGTVWLFEDQNVTSFLEKISFVQIVFVVTLSFLLSLWYGRSKFEVRFITSIASKEIVGQLCKVTAITLVAQATILSAFVLGAVSLSPEVSILNLLAAAAITSFAATLPISVNGWGVREIAAIYTFGQAGMEPSSAMGISVLVGLCSTAVILATWPYVFKRKQQQVNTLSSIKQTTSYLPIAKMSAYSVVMAVSILIFFQVHAPLPGGAISLNLADPFAILALAAIVAHAYQTSQVLRWTIPQFNLLLLVYAALLLFAFLNGVLAIGVTQWALVGRLLGSLVLLGYLCIGILAVTYLGKLGVLRFVETMVSTVVTIILFHALVRWGVFSGWLDRSLVTLNFQGFSENRNTFAFQLLICSTLLLAFARDSYKAAADPIFSEFAAIRKNNFPAIVLGVILAGVVFTGSRTGIVSGIVLLVIAAFSGFSGVRVIVRGIVYGFILWALFVWVLPSASIFFNQFSHESFQIQDNYRVQSAFSNPASNVQRWKTIGLGFEMWRDSPWFGAGLGVFIEKSLEWFDKPIVIHSTPLWVLAEFGLIGAGILLAVLIWIVIATVRSGPHQLPNRAVIMLLVTFLIFGLPHDIFYQRIFWLALGLCIALPFDDRHRQVLFKSSNPQ